MRVDAVLDPVGFAVPSRGIQIWDSCRRVLYGFCRDKCMRSPDLVEGKPVHLGELARLSCHRYFWVPRVLPVINRTPELPAIPGYTIRGGLWVLSERHPTACKERQVKGVKRNETVQSSNTCIRSNLRSQFITLRQETGLLPQNWRPYAPHAAVPNVPIIVEWLALHGRGPVPATCCSLAKSPAT